MEPEGFISDCRPIPKTKAKLHPSKDLPLPKTIPKLKEQVKIFQANPVETEQILNPVPMKNLDGVAQMTGSIVRTEPVNFKPPPADPERSSLLPPGKLIISNSGTIQPIRNAENPPPSLGPKLNEVPIFAMKKDDFSQIETKSEQLSNENPPITSNATTNNKETQGERTKAHDIGKLFQNQDIPKSPSIQSQNLQTEEFKQVLNNLSQYGDRPGQTQANINNLTEILRNLYSALPKDGEELPNLNKTLCKSCGNKKKKFLLDCGHQVCVHCLKKQCKVYIENPSLETFKKFACVKCKLSLVALDIQNLYANLPELEMLKTMSSSFKCTRCRNSYTLHNGYCSELPCMHLCNNCYFDDLLFKRTACNNEMCHMPFKKSALTSKRSSICDNCKAIGNSVFDCYRNICSNHYLCYQCLNKTAQQRKCQACDPSNGIITRQYKLLASMVNKECVICKKIKILNDFDLIKRCCCEPVCNECQQENICRNCNSFEFLR